MLKTNRTKTKGLYKNIFRDEISEIWNIYIILYRPRKLLRMTFCFDQKPCHWNNLLHIYKLKNLSGHGNYMTFI